MRETYYTVGEIAKKMGVSVRTLQYYDKEGLLAPTAHSEGGRRLYTDKDTVELHQILTLKYLGFSLDEIRKMRISLDTPEQVADALKTQRELIAGKIKNLQAALFAVERLRAEVLSIDRVDFEKYADIIALLKMGNENYWIYRAFDTTLANHVRNKFSQEPELGMKVLNDYQVVLDEAHELQAQGLAPDSEKGYALAEKWWNMIMDFTGGDMSLLPQLMAFNDNKTAWQSNLANKQAAVDGYIGLALENYFMKNSIALPDEAEI